MMMPLPGGAGIYYRKKDEKFLVESLLKPAGWSYKAVKWLEYLQEKQFEGNVIRHAMNGGEKSFRLNGTNFKPDGYCLIDGIHHFFFFHGCRYHVCNCRTSKESPFSSKNIDRDELLRKICSQNGRYIEIKECEFDELKIKMTSNKVSCFFEKMIAKGMVKEDEILQKIRSGQFYGFVSCDIHSPEEVVKRWKNFWGGPIFAHVTPTEEMMNPAMVAELKRRKVKITENQLSLVFNHESYIMTTELFLFYEKIGLKMSNLKWALEFTKDTPCRSFVEKMTACRKKAERDGNKALVELFKLVINSSYGSFGLNVKKHLNHTYKRATSRFVKAEGPRIADSNHLMGEFSTNWVEITSRKASVDDKTASESSSLFEILQSIQLIILVHFSSAILQNAKLRMLETIDMFLEHLDCDAMRIIYTDTGKL